MRTLAKFFAVLLIIAGSIGVLLWWAAGIMYYFNTYDDIRAFAGFSFFLNVLLPFFTSVGFVYLLWLAGSTAMYWVGTAAWAWGSGEIGLREPA